MMRIESNQPTKRNNAQLLLRTAAGAALGAGARFILPTKTEMGSMKTATDTFFSNAKTSARGANRSILKYAGIGALVAAGANLIAKTFKNGKENNEAIDFTKYEALYDTPADSAYAIMWYGDK